MVTHEYTCGDDWDRSARILAIEPARRTVNQTERLRRAMRRIVERTGAFDPAGAERLVAELMRAGGAPCGVWCDRESGAETEKITAS